MAIWKCRCAAAWSIIIVSLVFANPQSVIAGQFNRVLSIGDPAPPWTGLAGTDGQTHDLDDLESAEFVVVVFTCNSCPYAVDAEDRLLVLSQRAKDLGGALVAINVNTIEEDDLPAMKKKAEQKKFVFPYLFDPSQNIAKQYGATTTPEFFLLNKQRQVAYMGALDDSPDGKNVTKSHVEIAIGSLLSGEPIVTSETVPIGCRIRFARLRTRK